MYSNSSYEVYSDILKASAGKLAEALNADDRPFLVKVARQALDPRAPEDWCIYELKRLARHWEKLRKKYRGLFLTIQQGLSSPPVDPTEEMILGLLLNTGTVKKQKVAVEDKLQDMMRKVARRG